MGTGYLGVNAEGFDCKIMSDLHQVLANFIAVLMGPKPVDERADAGARHRGRDEKKPGS